MENECTLLNKLLTSGIAFPMCASKLALQISLVIWYISECISLFHPQKGDRFYYWPDFIYLSQYHLLNKLKCSTLIKHLIICWSPSGHSFLFYWYVYAPVTQFNNYGGKAAHIFLFFQNTLNNFHTFICPEGS